MKSTGLTPLGAVAMLLLAVLVIAALPGCQHVPPLGAKESKTEFGIPGIFKVQNETNNISVTEKQIRVGDTADDVQILLFELKHSAKGVRLTNPAEKP